jgi:alpha-tubulin suppressor-like RCC1 family protein
VLLWGEIEGAGLAVRVAISSGATRLVGNRASYAALGADGYVQAWGVAGYMRGFEAYQTGNRIFHLVANDGAYAGVDETGAAIAFGGTGNGNSITASGFSTQLATSASSVIPSAGSFAALMLDGTAYTWGNKYCGAGISTLTRADLRNIGEVVATATAFAAFLHSGGVVTWGGADSGGDSSAVSAQLQSQVVHLISTQSAFVAFKFDSGIVVWGNPWFGADATAVAAHLAADVVYVAHTSSAFAALKADGSVVTWGKSNYGGDSSAVQAVLQDVTTILGNHYSFAALSSDGSVVAWGDTAEGGAIPSSLANSLSAGVTELFATRRAFAALKGATGELVLWGNPYHGGNAGAAAAYLTSGVRTVCGNDAAFTAILQDGRAVAWGHASSVSTPGLLTGAGTFFNSVFTCA